METLTAQGVEVPALGFGTASRTLDHDGHRAVVQTAIEAGYRHIDTAQMYDNEAAVGEAIAAADVPREELFVTTKLDGANRARNAVHESTRGSLERLGLEYVDLLLIHYPNTEVSHEETLGAMNELRDEGLVEHVGVSNFSVEQTREAIGLSDAPILTNQVEYNVGCRQDDLLELCLDEDLLLTAYSPLKDVLDEPALARIGERYDKSAPQVALRWLLQQPRVTTIPQSATPEHIRANTEVWDFELTAAEMRDLFELTGELDDALAERLLP